MVKIAQLIVYHNGVVKVVLNVQLDTPGKIVLNVQLDTMGQIVEVHFLKWQFPYMLF